MSSDCMAVSMIYFATEPARSHLVEEDILSIAALCRKVFEVAVLIDAVLLA